MRLPPLSDEQCIEAVESLKEHGTATAAAKALGIPRTTLQSRLKSAARRGHAPGHFVNGVAPGFTMGKVTIQRNASGDIERTWERQSPELEQAMEAALEAFMSEIPRAPLVQAPLHCSASLLTLYTFTDYHLGALCWHKEGGADWDVDIAEKVGIAAMQALVAAAPAADTGVVNIQGDFLHADGLVPATPTSGHILDADSRFGKVVEVAIRLIRSLVNLALQKHSNVILLIAEGNHDTASSLWLRKMFKALYELEPRVNVNDSELPYYAVEWGYTLLGFHHGHMKKNDSLPALFAAQFRQQWGRAKYTVIHTGHRHHVEIKEHSGALVVQHPTLTAGDAYSARGGWISERAMSAITYHKRFGEVGQSRVTPLMLEAA